MNKLSSRKIQNLSFYLEEDANKETTHRIKSFIQEIQSNRNWLNSPPEFICFNEEIEGDNITTIGGEIKILSFDDGNLPPELDKLTLDDVKFLINEIQKISKKELLEFEFELDQNFVGSIKNGEMDRCLSEAFLGEWEKSINTTQPSQEKNKI